MCCISIAAHGEFPYTVEIVGEIPGELGATLEERFEVLKRQSEVPASETHLQRRLDRDEEAYLNTARALGYFAAEFTYEIDKISSPAVVYLKLSSGTQYELGAVTLELSGNMLPPETWVDALGLAEGDAALSESIRDAEARLLATIRKASYPHPTINKRDVQVNHANQRVNVVFGVAPGTSAKFGAVTVEGLEAVEESVVLRALPWKEGEDFNATLLAQAQEKLLRLNLFSSADITLPNAVDEGGALPIAITVRERKHRSIGIGVQYSTDDGVGVQLDWRHRNFRGLGNPLSLGLHFNQRIWGLEAEYQISPFLDDAQSLRLHAAVKSEDIDAYNAEYTRFGAVLGRVLRKDLTLEFGGGIHLSQVAQLGDTNDYQLLYGLGRLRLDRSNDKLDPTKGYRIQLSAEPYLGFELSPKFLKTDLEATHYWRLNKESEDPEQDRPLSLAVRLHFGTTFGESWRDIPADLRYYSGGGGALRGYPYRSVSELRQGTPIGGESIYEFSLEFRKKIAKNIGLAFFVEHGSAFNGPITQMLDDAQWSAGIGGRYYSPIGPMRIDLAVPLERRDGIDNLFQIYFSVGQAF